MFIVGILGKKQHGKDTLAKMLIEEKDFITLDDFAEPIRQALCAIFGWKREDFETEEKKEMIDEIFKISKRQGMQSLGDDYAKDMLCALFPTFKEAIGDNLWVIRYLQSLTKARNYYASTGKDFRVVVPGVRFEPEVDTIRNKLGGKIIKVFDPRKPDTDTHKSEKRVDLFPFDHLIINDGTKEDLRKKLLDYISSIRLESDVALPDDLVDLVIKR